MKITVALPKTKQQRLVGYYNLILFSTIKAHKV